MVLRCTDVKEKNCRQELRAFLLSKYPSVNIHPVRYTQKQMLSFNLLLLLSKTKVFLSTHYGRSTKDNYLLHKYPSVNIHPVARKQKQVSSATEGFCRKFWDFVRNFIKTRGIWDFDLNKEVD